MAEVRQTGWACVEIPTSKHWTERVSSAIFGAAVTSVCPRCANARDQRDGPYFVCVDCRWRWTVSITGKVYLQSVWSQTPHRDVRALMVRRLLESVDGLEERLRADLAAPPDATDEARLSRAGFDPGDIARLRRARDATVAAYFNEGVPLSILRAEGVVLPPTDNDITPEGA